MIQALRYHVARNQRGWVRALPRVCFAIMNTVNVAQASLVFIYNLGDRLALLPPFTLRLSLRVGKLSTRTAYCDSLSLTVSRLETICSWLNWLRLHRRLNTAQRTPPSQLATS